MSPRNPLSATYERNLWLFEFQESGSLEDLFVEVGGFVEKHEKALRLVVDKSQIDLFCGYYPKDSQDGFSIDHESLQKIVRLPVNIIFDVYPS